MQKPHRLNLQIEHLQRTLIGSTLKADNQINLLAAQNTDTLTSINKSSSASVGVSLNTTTGLSANASISQGKGHANGTDVSYTETVVQGGNKAGDKVALQSGTDTNLIGAEVKGNQVVANVGTTGQGNLNIQSLQDTSTYDSKQSSAGVGVSIPIAGTGFAVSANLSQTKMNGDYASVVEQSGIKAGDGGFQITTNGNTNLTGAVIASTQTAIDNNANSLTTKTLTVSDLQNKADYSASQTSLGVGYSTGSGNVGKDRQGKAQTDGTQVPGTTLSNLNGFSATTPVALSASDSNSSTTLSGISAGNLNITDSNKQQALTGKDAATTVATLNQDVHVVNTTDANGNTTAITVDSQGNNTAHSIAPLLTDAKKAEINADFAIVQAFTNETSTFLTNRAKESTAAQKTIDAELAKDNPDATVIAQATQTLAENATWSMGGTGRTILTALTLASAGNVTGSSGEFIQAAAVNYLQSLGVQQIKQIADEFKTDGQANSTSETVRTALQGLAACAGAAASGNNCGTAALAASSSVVINTLLDQVEGKDSNNLTPAEKEARLNLLTTLVTGITAAAGGNAAVANAAATIETENNGLLEEGQFFVKHPQIAIAIGSYKDPKTVKDPNITTIASTFQLNLLGSGAEGSASNAFRHVIWQALITSQFGEGIAVEVGNAHDSSWSSDISKTFSTLTDADTTADQLNNTIGRQIALKNPGISNTKLAEIILINQSSDGFYQATLQTDNTYKVEKVKL